MSDDKRRWLDRLLGLLPPLIRPKHDDPRFLAACHVAYDNDWTPEQLAAVLTARDYTAARNPQVIAIMRLEETAAIPPTPPATITITPICERGCVEGWLDPEPPQHTINPLPPPRGQAYPPQQHPTVRSCPTCRPQLAARLAKIPPPGQRADTHHAYLRNARTMR